MGFVPVKSDHGAVPPWEYLEANAGTYKAGQLLNVADGKLTAVSEAATTTPPYICMADATVEEDEILPVIRTSKDYTYETELGAAAADAAVGGKLQVSAGGLSVEAGEGTFEIAYLNGTEAGATVRGRWA